jgi:hypothetical protein
MDPPVSLGSRLRGFVRAGGWRLVVLATAAGALVAILPAFSEANPDYEDAQLFLDDMALVTTSLRGGVDVPSLDYAGDQITWSMGTRDDGATASVVIGFHADHCFVVHWLTPGEVGPRGGVLDPSFECGATQELLETLPAPPFVLAFPGIVPPFDASRLIRPAESRANPERIEPFPKERTPWWFVPAVLALLALVLSSAVGVMLPSGRRIPPDRRRESSRRRPS